MIAIKFEDAQVKKAKVPYRSVEKYHYQTVTSFTISLGKFSAAYYHPI